MKQKNLKHTALYELHRALGAKMIPFAGFVMPLRYSGDKDEHQCVRHAAGLFDVSHMGEILLRGSNALKTLNYLITNDAARLNVGDAQYSSLCYPSGGYVDDIIVYRTDRDEYMVCVNAANKDKDYEWFIDNNKYNAEITDESDEYSQLAVQGQRAIEIVEQLTDADINAIGRFKFITAEVAGAKAIIARTGYTGEDGVELFIKDQAPLKVAEALLDKGKAVGLKPIGLGARDSLRLEAALPLYGNDIDDKRTPIEAGMGWTVKVKKEEFIGKEVLARQKSEGTKQRLIGFVMLKKGIPRQHYVIHKDDQAVGEVTSGVFAPYVNAGIGLGYVPSELAKTGTQIDVEIRGTLHPAVIVETPFHKNRKIIEKYLETY